MLWGSQTLGSPQGAFLVEPCLWFDSSNTEPFQRTIRVQRASIFQWNTFIRKFLTSSNLGNMNNLLLTPFVFERAFPFMRIFHIKKAQLTLMSYPHPNYCSQTFMLSWFWLDKLQELGCYLFIHFKEASAHSSPDSATLAHVVFMQVVQQELMYQMCHNAHCD